MNRRDDIIQTALQLFIRQGYHATSIREIAAGVGCRESASYVHFENGKRELLQTILAQHMPDFDEILSRCAPGSAPENAFDCLGQRMVALAQTHLQEWQWVAGEFPTLKAGERAIVRAKLVELHQGMTGYLRVHSAVSDAAAQAIAWTLMALLSGYAQLHRIGEPDFDTGFSPDHFANMFKVLLAGTVRPIEQANVQ
jgi:AcrR family transcriptional regulator